MRYLSLIITLMIYSLTVQAQPRYALVICNSNYNSPGKKGYLTNPVNDAKDMKALLTNQLGFTVIEGYNVNKMEFDLLIQKFNSYLIDSKVPAVALFDFSGHGFSGKDRSDNDTNYLVPLWPKKAPPRDQVSLEYSSISSNYIVTAMRRYNKKGINMMVLDACRGSPNGFVQSYKEEEKGSQSGFVSMNSSGVFLAYATALGRSSYGVTDKRNSIYTGKLLEVLKERAFWHKNITEVFNETAFRVANFTQHFQEPWFSASGVKFCFEDCLQPKPSPKPDSSSEQLRTCQRHFDAYRLTTGVGGTALSCYSEVLKKDPNNAEALAGLDKIAAKYVTWIEAALINGKIDKAKQHLEGLRQVSPESRVLAAFEERIFPKLLPLSQVDTSEETPSYFSGGLRRQIVSVWQAIVLGVIVILLIWGWRHHKKSLPLIKKQRRPTISRSHALRGNALPDAERPAPQSGANRHSHAERGNEETQDIVTNSIGMKFKLIKAGKFQMGSEKGDSDEKPVHWVEITKDFYMGIYQVTVGQYKKYVDEKGGYFDPDYNKQGDNAAVTRVSWNDAQGFISWLNKKEGGSHYRLPTEAQWEYSARAGTTTEYSFGDDSSLLGDYAWYSDNSGAYAHIVGQKKPNPWGLYDMHGNIWEWVADIYSRYSSSLYSDPTGPSTGSFRVVRGGGWYFTASYCRAAFRSFSSQVYRSSDLGFRLLRQP